MQKEITKKAILEACKEPLRLLILAIIPFLLVWIGTINTEWAFVILAFLRFADKALHEIGKATDSDQLTKGLTGF